MLSVKQSSVYLFWSLSKNQLWGKWMVKLYDSNSAKPLQPLIFSIFSAYLFRSLKTHCATKKDIAPENPEAATVSGFFRVHFWLHEKKISSHLFHVRWGLELKLRAFAPNFEWATRKNFCFFENYFVKFLWTKWFVLKCSTNHFSIPHILAVTFLRWRPFFFSDKIKMRAQRALRTGGN